MKKIWIWLFNYHIKHGGHSEGTLINDKWVETKKVKGNILAKSICKLKLCNRGERILYPRDAKDKS